MSLDLRYEHPLEEAVLLRRYKRFLADVEHADGRVQTVHVANPGSMKTCAEPGRPVRILDSHNPKRKLSHSLEQVRMGRTWVNVNTARANGLVGSALARGAIPTLADWQVDRAEVRHACGSRFDFRLVGHHGTGEAWLEVKQVSMRVGNTAQFPDAVTARGRRHLEHLAGLARDGEPCVVVFCVSRSDVDSVAIAWDLDPAFGSAALAACEAGVRFVAVQQQVRKTGISIARELPLVLTHE